MAKVEYSEPIRDISGAICQEDGNVHRTNHYVVDGKVVGVSAKSVFHRRSRDFEKTRMKGRELENALGFGEANRLASAQRADPVLCERWKQRFLAQCKKPEPGMKQYVKFDAYVVAMIRLGKGLED